jgi:hypothetical protein
LPATTWAETASPFSAKAALSPAATVARLAPAAAAYVAVVPVGPPTRTSIVSGATRPAPDRAVPSASAWVAACVTCTAYEPALVVAEAVRKLTWLSDPVPPARNRPATASGSLA